MRPLAIAAVLPTLLFLMLSSCGKGSEEFIQNGPTTYSVSAEYGPTMGGWDRPKDEATAKATQFCEREGQQVALRDEQRSASSFPDGPQKSTITFACVSDASSAGQAGVATPAQATAGEPKRSQQGDYNAGNKMILNGKRMVAIKKCTDGLKFDSDRYVACVSKEGKSP